LVVLIDKRFYGNFTEFFLQWQGNFVSLPNGILANVAQYMIIYIIIIIGVIAFWIHAERKLGFGFRILATMLVVTTITLFLQSVHRIHSFYDRGYVAEALKTMVEGEQVQNKELYFSMIERYKYGKTTGGAFLMNESRRIQDLRKEIPAEQDSMRRK
jgi:hypothetical protein